MKFKLWLCWMLISVVTFNDVDAYIQQHYNKTVCVPPTKSKGPIPPKLPLNFVAWEEYFAVPLSTIIQYAVDWDHNKVAQIVCVQEICTRRIIDYNTEQLIEIITENSDMHSIGHSYKCKVKGLESFGELGKVDHIGNEYVYLTELVKRAFFYDNQFAFEKRSHRRGLPVNLFKGCIFQDGVLNSTFNVELGFANESVYSASGYKTMPISVRASNNAGKMDDDDPNSINIIENIFWFDSMKKKYHKYFQIPEGTYCKGYSNMKPFPGYSVDFKIATEILYDRAELIHEQEKIIQKLFYHNEVYSTKLQLERVDLTPGGDLPYLSSKYGGIPITVIHDMKTGDSYVINKATNMCDYYENIDILKELNSAKFRFIDNLILKNKVKFEDFHFKGQGPCGDYSCDIWTTQLKDNVSYRGRNVSVWVEVYYLENWNIVQDKGRQPNIPFQLISYFNYSKGVQDVFDKIQLKIYQYEFDKPSVFDFDIQTCFKGSGKKYAKITFSMVSADYNVLSNTRKVLEGFVDAVSFYTAISPIQVQDLQLSLNKEKKLFYMMFSIVDNHNGLPNGTFVTLDEAMSTINSLVSMGQFFFTITDANLTVMFTSIKGSLKFLLPTSSPHRVSLAENNSLMFENHAPQGNGSSKENDSKHLPVKYSKAVLVVCIFLMLLLGIVFGAVLTIALLRYEPQLFGAERNDNEEMQMELID